MTNEVLSSDCNPPQINMTVNYEKRREPAKMRFSEAGRMAGLTAEWESE